MVRAPLIVITYEYVPQGGDPTRPIRINGVKESSTGDRGRHVDAYLFDIPEGLTEGVPTKWETEDWLGVLNNLAQWFPGETPNGASKRLKRVYSDPVHFPPHLYGD
jgi:hypothetical protein